MQKKVLTFLLAIFICLGTIAQSLSTIIQDDIQELKGDPISDHPAFSKLGYQNIFISDLEKLMYFQTKNAQSNQEFLLDSTYYYAWSYDTYEFVDDEKDIFNYEYEDNKHITSIIKKRWSNESEIWSPFRKLVVERDDEANITLSAFYSWSSQYETWVGNQKSAYEYDDNNNLLLFKGFWWDNFHNEWIWSTKSIYTYDDNDNLIQNSTFKWQSGDWVGHQQYIYQYDQMNNITEYVFQIWSNMNNDWLNSQKRIYTYDQNDNLIEELRLLWNNSNEEWRNFFKYLFEYDENENLVSDTRYSFSLQINDWIGVQKFMFEYDNYENKTEEVVYDWNEDWIPYQKKIWEYNSAGNITYYNFQVWFDDEWRNFSMYTQEFNNFENIIKRLDYGWSIDENEWFNYGETTYEYDEYQNLIEIVNFNYNPEQNEWFGVLKIRRFYSEISTNIFDIDANILKIYPNPASNQIHISGIEMGSEIWVYDLSGRMLIEETSVHNTEIVEISTLTPGVYILEVRKGNSVQSIKFIKQ